MLNIVQESGIDTEEAREAYRELHNTCAVKLCEKCDCRPHRITHNNGGNYHAVLLLARSRSGRYSIKHTDTCELPTGWDYWEKVSHDKMVEELNKFFTKDAYVGYLDAGLVQILIEKVTKEV